jgi:SCY1-like protein 1
VDSWAFGCLVFSVFNGQLSRTEQLTTLGNIPQKLHQGYKGLLQHNMSGRIPLAKFLESTTRSGGYFDDEFVKTSVFLDEIALKTSEEKEAYVKYFW